MDAGSGHPLYNMLIAAAADRFPPVDGVVEVLAPGDPDGHAVVEFTGHAVVLTDRSRADGVFDGVDAFGGTSAPSFLHELADGRSIGSHDVVLVRRGRGSSGPGPDETDRYDDHPRVVRARHHRSDVRVFGAETGLVTIGRGLVGRVEISVELLPGVRRSGAGRSLIDGGLTWVAPDEWVFAQVAVGNAASLRAFLGSGFVPIGSEVLFGPS